MLNAIIIEDERLAMQELVKNLAEASPDVQITATLTSVQESIEYLSQAPDADIIFSDVQLPDGLSFEIFNYTTVDIPIIFITGYDEFIMNAFEYNGIDYLLKPVSKEDLAKAIMKYKMLEKHFRTGNKQVEKLVQVGIRDYCQEELDVIQLRLVVSGEWHAALRADLEQQIVRVVGESVQLEIAIVDDIPLTAAGKRKVVVRRLSSDAAHADRVPVAVS